MEERNYIGAKVLDFTAPLPLLSIVMASRPNSHISFFFVFSFFFCLILHSLARIC